MAHWDPQGAFEILKKRVSNTIQDQFPIEGKKNELVATKVWVDDNKHIDDVRGQMESKLRDRTWSVPVRAELELRDKETGKVKDRMAYTLAQLPKITNRYTYIVGGNEWQVNNMFRRRRRYD
jgi:DNA-directed RNA polymerase beta subunit